MGGTGQYIDTAALLLFMSTLDWPNGVFTSLPGVVTAAVCLTARRPPTKLVWAISAGVLPLAAGLFVLGKALDRTGVIGIEARALSRRYPECAARLDRLGFDPRELVA